NVSSGGEGTHPSWAGIVGEEHPAHVLSQRADRETLVLEQSRHVRAPEERKPEQLEVVVVVLDLNSFLPSVREGIDPAKQIGCVSLIDAEPHFALGAKQMFPRANLERAGLAMRVAR